MLLAINIGNTNITVGIFNEENLEISFKIPIKSTNPGNILREKLKDFSGIDGVVIGSVVPDVTPLMIEVLEKLSLSSPLVVDSKMNLPIKLNVDYPEKVGVDLLSNMVAAHMLYNNDSIILDSGTATTFCSLSKEGIFSGAVIAIGLDAMSNSLSQNGAQLPDISIKKHDGAVGKNTIEAMQLGIYWGYVDLVQGMINRLKSKVGEVLIIGTGGNLELVAKDLKGIGIIDSDLTIEGLRIIYKLNT